MKTNLIDLSIVALLILCAACVAHCDETNKVSAATNPPPIVVSDTAELKTDGPLSHFQLYGQVVTNKVVIKRVDTIVDVIQSNTMMRVFSWTTNGWVTNDNIPSAIAPVALPPVTNIVVIP